MLKLDGPSCRDVADGAVNTIILLCLTCNNLVLPDALLDSIVSARPPRWLLRF